MTLEKVEAILGPGEEISREQVPQYAQQRTSVDGKLTNAIVEGDRVFFWKNDHVPGAGWGYYISFKDNKVLEKHELFPKSVALFFVNATIEFGFGIGDFSDSDCKQSWPNQWPHQQGQADLRKVRGD